jgi:hypothetical protein
VVESGTPATVSANVSGGYEPGLKLKYNWVLSAGVITSGQGTPTITIDTNGLAGESVTATVEVGGFPSWCDRTQSCTLAPIDYAPSSRLFGKYGEVGRAREDERLAQFGAALRDEPGAQGYIFYYGPRRVDQRLSRAQKFLVSKSGIDPGRITAVNAGRRKKFSAQLWIRPTGAMKPQPDPEPDPRF